MASLAFIVSLIFICVIIIGPLSYSLSKFKWIPNSLIYFLGASCIGIGLWWFFLPIPMIRYYGLVDMFLGYKTILQRYEQTS